MPDRVPLRHMALQRMAMLAWLRALRDRRAAHRRRAAQIGRMMPPVNDTFPAESHEMALDKAMLIDQERDRRRPDGEAGCPHCCPPPSPPLLGSGGAALVIPDENASRANASGHGPANRPVRAGKRG